MIIDNSRAALKRFFPHKYTCFLRFVHYSDCMSATSPIPSLLNVPHHPLKYTEQGILLNLSCPDPYLVPCQ